MGDLLPIRLQGSDHTEDSLQGEEDATTGDSGDHTEDVVKYERDVTIYLMPNSITGDVLDSIARPTRKRKLRIPHNLDKERSHNATPLCEIQANSTRLLQCNKYFAMCMSERWNIKWSEKSAAVGHFSLKFRRRNGTTETASPGCTTFSISPLTV